MGKSTISTGPFSIAELPSRTALLQCCGGLLGLVLQSLAPNKHPVFFHEVFYYLVDHPTNRKWVQLPQ